MIGFCRIAAAGAVCSGIAAIQVAHATTIYKWNVRNPGTACTLSIPTTDTGVRPKASGFRNEGGSNSFVICGFDINSDNTSYEQLDLGFRSFDKQMHSFSCSAVDQITGTDDPGEYSTKNVVVGADGHLTALSYLPSDFPNEGLTGWNASITCLLPPGVSINVVGAPYEDDIGN